MRKKLSLFSRLTGSISPDSYDDLFEADDLPEQKTAHHASAVVAEDSAITTVQLKEHGASVSPSEDVTSKQHVSLAEEMGDPEEADQEGELAVDVYQTTDFIVVKALIAGVNPSSVDISLTRDMITIRGHREEHTETTEENYFYKELYWGSFVRTILLPEEVDVDMAEASTDHGILVIKLPKINKERKMKLKVKSGTLR